MIFTDGELHLMEEITPASKSRLIAVSEESVALTEEIFLALVGLRRSSPVRSGRSLASGLQNAFEFVCLVADRVIVLNSRGELVQDSHPADAYDTPQSVEAATLTGLASVVRATVTNVFGHSIEVRSLSGVHLQTRWSQNGVVAHCGQAVDVVIRPDWGQVMLAPDPSKGGAIAAVVTRAVRLGSHTYVRCRLGEDEILLEHGYTDNIPIDRTVWIDLRADKMMSFPQTHR